MKVYIVGSLRNPAIPQIGCRIREAGFDAFDDWHAAGELGDSYWQTYEKARGRSYLDALQGRAAQHAFNYDKHHLDTCDAGVLVCPAGKSGFAELGYLLGQGKPGYILLDDPDRWDLMVLLATGVYTDLDEIITQLKEDRHAYRYRRGWSLSRLQRWFHSTCSRSNR